MLGPVIGIALCSIALVVSGTVVVSVANRAAKGQLKKNSLAGIRTRATMASAEAWNAAHVAGHRFTVLGGQAAVITGGTGLGLAVVVALVDDSNPVLGAWAIATGIGMTVMLSLVIKGSIDGHRAAKAAA